MNQFPDIKQILIGQKIIDVKEIDGEGGRAVVLVLENGKEILFDHRGDDMSYLIERTPLSVAK